MAYKGGVPVNSGFYPRNDFPIAEAKDIYVSDDQRLDAVLAALAAKTEEANNADTVDGMHAEDFAKADDFVAAQGEISELQTLVGDIKVSEQIAEAIANQDLFSGDYNDLENKPNITDNKSNDLEIADEAGNVIFKVNKDGIHTTALTLNGEDIQATIDTYVLTIDYEKLLAFNTAEIVIGSSSGGDGPSGGDNGNEPGDEPGNENAGTSAMLGVAILGQMVLG